MRLVIDHLQVIVQSAKETAIWIPLKKHRHQKSTKSHHPRGEGLKRYTLKPQVGTPHFGNLFGQQSTAESRTPTRLTLQPHENPSKLAGFPDLVVEIFGGSHVCVGFNDLCWKEMQHCLNEISPKHKSQYLGTYKFTPQLSCLRIHHEHEDEI